MTFDDDYIRVDQRLYFRCKDLGLSWPPPKFLYDEEGKLLEQISCSELTDEERAGMTHVCRGADYRTFRDYTSFTGRKRP